MHRINTKIFRNILQDHSEPLETSEILKTGGLVVFPTETVYGLGANALDSSAVDKIFKAKGRPGDNPLIVHLYDLTQISTVVSHIPQVALKLFETFSPGPLTIVLPKSKNLPGNVTAGLPTVAVRVPSHPIARLLLKESGLPIAAPSANRSGRPSPTTFAMALEEMDGRVDAIIDGGDSEVGLESTVISVSEKEIRILRPGAVTEEMLKTAVGPEMIITAAAQDKSRPASPGMKYTHYKPKAEVYLCRDIQSAAFDSRFSHLTLGILTLDKTFPMAHGSMQIIEFSDLDDYAKGLYKAMIELDRGGCAVILAQAVEEKGIGRAIMNRLTRASGGKEIK